MIVRLRGPVVEADADRLVVDCHGVGYEVFVPESVAFDFSVLGETVELMVRQVVRETDVTLYGFSNKQQRRLFDLLREVKGCGSKTSLALLGTLGESGLVDAIVIQEARTLTKAPGVGPRLAERIIVDLKEKVAELDIERRAVVRSTPSSTVNDDELLEALLALGYRRNEVEQAAEAARHEADTVEDQVRAALKRLAK